jgi:uncharacterized protein YxeA
MKEKKKKNCIDKGTKGLDRAIEYALAHPTYDNEGNKIEYEKTISHEQTKSTYFQNGNN